MPYIGEIRMFAGNFKESARSGPVGGTVAGGIALGRSRSCPPDEILALAHGRERMFRGMAVLVGKDSGIGVTRAALLDDAAGHDPVCVAPAPGRHAVVDASAFVFPGFAALAVVGGFAVRSALWRG